MDKRFGDLEHVQPATLWKSETGEFLPWLAAEDNLCRLGRALGLDLESVAREVPVGRFRADILCRDRDTGGAVVIEAQLGHSDHAHLGQVLAYATGLSDAAAVWIATRFHKEHCAILERLNDPDGAGYRCFAVEMRLWKIGASLIAPQFNVFARPGARSRPRRVCRRPGIGSRRGAAAGACGGPRVARGEPDKDSPAEPRPLHEAIGASRRHQRRHLVAYRDRQAPRLDRDAGRPRQGARLAGRHAELKRARGRLGRAISMSL